MNIRIAKYAGFCFGVKRATGLLEAEVDRAGEHPEENRRICTLGRIIHNDRYMEEIRSRGVETVSREDVPELIRRGDAGEAVTVVIRAHGELKDLQDALEDCARRNSAFRVLDGTCPYVKKVREIAAAGSGEGKLFLLSGNAHHPEVEGILSCAKGETAVFPDAESLRIWLETQKSSENCEKCITMAAQTTQKLAEWRKSINFIKKDYANAKIFDTICSVTELRQEECASMAAESDFMIVIGSPDSSNSRKLYEISKELCRDTVFLTDGREMPEILARLRERPVPNLSITAGASTPFSLIQEVYTTMNENTENFAELLESSFKTLNTGEIVEGIVTAVTPGEIHLDLGAKTTGVIARDKATDDPQAKLEDLFKVGDTVAELPASLATAAENFATVTAIDGNVLTLSAAVTGLAADDILAVVGATDKKVKATPNALLPYDVVRDADAISVDGDGMWANERPVLERRMPAINDAIKAALVAAGCDIKFSNRK